MKALLHVSLFVASLLGTSTFLREFDVVPFWGWTAPKVEVLRTSANEFDTLFFGSSRLHYALQPEVFDARSAELGSPSNSFSVAFSGTRMLDTVRVLDWLVSHKPRNLERVVVELHTTSQEIRWTQWMTDQEIEMHAPCVLPGRLRSIWWSEEPLTSRFAQSGYCLVHSLMCQLCVGQGNRIVNDFLDVLRGEPLARVWPVANRGWVPVEGVGLEHMVRFHEEFPTRWSEWENVIVSRMQNPAPDWLAGGFDVESVVDIGSRLRLVGVEPTFVVMPTLSMDFRGRDAVEQIRSRFRVLELDRPAGNRPLFDRSCFYDTSHLSAHGAQVFSRYLAEQLVACEELPLDRDPAPRLLPASGIAFTAKPAEDGSPRIEFAADEMPFVGEAVVIAASERRDMPLPGGVVLGVPWPAPHVHPLKRDSVYRASGSVEWGGIDPAKPLYVQLAVVDKDVVVAVSPVVELPPRR